MNWLQVSHLIKYNNGTLVLNDVQFAFGAFRRLAVAGETGSGKTTLLKIIAGLVQPDSGGVFFEGSRVLGPNEKLLPGDPRIGYLSQHFELRNNYKVDDYLAMASKLPENEAQRIYRLCQIDHLLRRRTDELSGGERQRTALARLLIASPRLLLLDEPYSNLDGLHKRTLKTVLRNIAKETGTACILVSHDPADVLSWAEEVLVLQGGKVVQHGRPEEVYRQPASEYVGGLFGDYNLLLAAQGKAIFRLDNATTSKKLFIRPENIRLTKNDNSPPGIIVGVLFVGSYYQIEAEFFGVVIFARTADSSFQVGDKVAASVAPHDVWSL